MSAITRPEFMNGLEAFLAKHPATGSGLPR